jgi:hypothetical protein
MYSKRPASYSARAMPVRVSASGFLNGVRSTGGATGAVDGDVGVDGAGLVADAALVGGGAAGFGVGAWANALGAESVSKTAQATIREEVERVRNMGKLPGILPRKSRVR